MWSHLWLMWDSNILHFEYVAILVGLIGFEFTWFVCTDDVLTQMGSQSSRRFYGIGPDKMLGDGLQTWQSGIELTKLASLSMSALLIILRDVTELVSLFEIVWDHWVPIIMPCVLGHEHKPLSLSRVNAHGFPGNWFWRVGSVAHS